MKGFVLAGILLVLVLFPAAALQVGQSGAGQETAALLEYALLEGFPPYGKEETGMEAALISFSEKVPVPGTVLIEAQLRITWQGYSRVLLLSGSGSDRDEALEDMAGYLSRLISYEVLSVPGLVSGPRIERIDRSQVFLLSPDPISRGGKEFRITDEEGTGLLRVRPLSYWKHQDEQRLEKAGNAVPGYEQPWLHYLPVDVLYTDIPLRPGMTAEPVNRTGISLTLKGGYVFPSKAGITLEASLDSLFSAWYPLVRGGYHMGTDSGESSLAVMGGWGITLYPRWNITQQANLLHKVGFDGSFAAGWTFNPGVLTSAVTGGVTMFLSPRYRLGVFAELFTEFPAGELKVSRGLSTGVSVTLRL